VCLFTAARNTFRVTGAAGFIGLHLCEALLARGDDVLGIDCFTDYYDPARKQANLAWAREAGLRFAAADLAQAALDPLLEGAEVVYHLAGQPGVRTSFGDDFAGRAAILDRRPGARGDAPHTRADLTAARADLDYRPQTPLEAGLEYQVAAAVADFPERRSAIGAAPRAQRAEA
jgi:nucleoside-diphosphate-sugar epimerase